MLNELIVYWLLRLKVHWLYWRYVYLKVYWLYWRYVYLKVYWLYWRYLYLRVCWLLSMHLSLFEIGYTVVYFNSWTRKIKR